MNEITVKILLVLLTCSFTLIGQEQIAYIEIDAAFEEQKEEFQFLINEVDVTVPSSKIEVPINQSGFDTIKLIRSDVVRLVAIMKLKQNHSYSLAYNSCSFYTLQPKIDPLQGMTHFRIESNTDESYFVGIDYFRELSRNMIDEFYYSPPSAMCFFAARPIEVRTIKEERILEVKYHFLHGELIGVVYDSTANSLEINLYGHIRDKSDYRHYYQVNKQ